MRFRAILERLDDIESRMTEVTRSRNPSQFDEGSVMNEEQHQPFSKQSGLFEMVDRCKNYIFNFKLSGYHKDRTIDNTQN